MEYKEDSFTERLSNFGGKNLIRDISGNEQEGFIAEIGKDYLYLQTEYEADKSKFIIYRLENIVSITNIK